MKRVISYVDGLNLYHGAKDFVRHSGEPGSWKWLDLNALCSRLCPHDSLIGIKYYTAHLIGPPSDVRRPSRQQTYLRAVSSIPEVSIHLGNFMMQKKRMPLVASLSHLRLRLVKFHGIDLRRHKDGNISVPVWRMEEKGTDVNLGVQLVADAFQGAFDKAVVISNDSDLVEPIRMVVHDLDKEVIVVNPRGHRPPAMALRNVASGVRQLRMSTLLESQMPDEIHDAQGLIRKPQGW